jgi:hypothetical protein
MTALRWLPVAALTLAAFAPVRAQVSLVASPYTETFDGMGNGTAAPAGWTVHVMAGNSTTWTTNISATTVGGGTANATLVPTGNFSALSGSGGFNYAEVATPANRALGSAPTGIGGIALQLSLTNNTGAPLTGIQIAYDIRRFAASAGDNELPGYRLFYSTDGGTTWTNVTALNPTIAGPGGVIVPNSAGTTAVPATAISFAVANGSGLLLRWIDDNAQTHSDQPLGIDNLSISFGPVVPPTVTLTSPTAAYSGVAPATIPFAATANDTDGSIARVEFYQGAVKVGEDTTAPYTFDWTGVPAGNYTVSARAFDNSGASANSTAVNITVTPNSNQTPVVDATAPAGNATGIAGSINLQISIADPEGDPQIVTFYGRKTVPPAPAGNFSLIAIPDTQFYSENTGRNPSAGGTGAVASIFAAQTQWITDQRNTRNIAFVSHMGDFVQNGDFGGNPAEWQNADAAMRTIENLALTLRAYGIPWGGAPGNHDLGTGGGSGTSALYNQFFGSGRFAGRTCYGGQYGTNNNNNYQLFGAGGLDFIVIHLEYDTTPDTAVLDWADALLKAHPDRRAIITSHWIINTGNPASFGGQGQAIYDALKDNPNLFLMLCGHVHGEGRRSDTFNGTTVHSVLQDYQSAFNGGNGFLRIFTFSPSTNQILAETWSPTLNRAVTTGDVATALGNFSMSYDMQSPVSPWIPLGTANVSANGTTASLPWTGLEPDAHYEWFATSSDGIKAASTAPRRFSTAAAAGPSVTLTAPADNATVNVPANVTLTANASDSDGTVAKVEFFRDSTKLGEDTAAPYELVWIGPATGAYALTAVATDNDGLTALSNLANLSVVNPANTPPAVSLTAPANNATFSAGSNITLTANASDTDGTISKVEFFQGITKLGEDPTAPYSFIWNGVSAGNYSITAKATDNDAGTTTSAAAAIRVQLTGNVSLVAKNAVWKYLDNGSDQGTAWRASGFDDTTWASGPAELGYGDAPATTVSFGGNAAAKHITTYFRRTFAVADPSALTALTLNILRDDGAVVYLNGSEIGRSNMGNGTILSSTLAPSPAVGGTDESTYFPLTFSTDPLPLLVSGNNTLAVEIHQQAADSSDLSFNLELLGLTTAPDPSGSLVRGPYLLSAGPDRLTVRWRTSQAVTGVVRFGLSPGNLTSSATGTGSTANHVVTLTGLTANTTYYYSIGTANSTLAGADPDHRFTTPPPAGTVKNTRIWVIGDSGTKDANQVSVRNAFTAFTGNRTPDLWLMLGDNAYDSGTDAEYQAAVFDVYPDYLRTSPLWPTLGNHDTAGSTNETANFPYFDMFTLPTAGECGGSASGTEKYYAFDHANIHFICLDSMTSNRSASGPMAVWLQNDLASTTATWIIAFWHHPPYTKGSHNSDTESQLLEMRQNFLPILEAGGVDLVLGGHSHSYERSFLLDGHYGSSGTLTPAMKKNAGDGRVTGNGAYTKPLIGPRDHFGAVYAVAGSSGKTSNGTLDHPAMFISLKQLGSMVLDIDGNRLDAIFLRETGAIDDRFTILKQGQADTDSDGIPDSYELAHGLDRADPGDANSDGERDGYTAKSEYLFGLAADVPDRYDWSVTRNASTGSREIAFPTITERLYRVWWSPTLLTWNPGSAPISGDGTIKSWTDDGSVTGTPPDQARARFYRVGVDPAP